MNKKVNLIRENYTTKNCANCFKINEKITKEKKFECEYCKKKMDRDMNAAKNMMIISINI